MRIRGKLQLLVCLGTVCVLGACDLESEFGTSNPPSMRIVNASNTGTMTVHLDGIAAPMVTVGPATATPNCPLLAPGVHVISFLENGALRDEFTGGYERDTRYVTVLANSGTTFRAFAVATDQAVAGTSNGLTLINATTAAGDVYVTAASDAPSASTLVASNIPPAATTTVEPPFVVTPAENFRVRLFDVGTTTNPRADISLIPLLEERLAIIVFVDRVIGTDPGAIQVDPCDPL